LLSAIFSLQKPLFVLTYLVATLKIFQKYFEKYHCRKHAYLRTKAHRDKEIIFNGKLSE